MADDFAHGTVHTAPSDLQAAVAANPETLALWQRLTPLGRNEFICWVEDLLEGKKRPCCWSGCIHRTDKPPSKWQQAVLIDKKRI
jgi:hypothetical protein